MIALTVFLHRPRTGAFSFGIMEKMSRKFGEGIRIVNISGILPPIGAEINGPKTMILSLLKSCQIHEVNQVSVKSAAPGMASSASSLPFNFTLTT